jgi:hypothetical protein
MVGTTTEFSVEIVEALAPPSCRRISWKYPQYHEYLFHPPSSERVLPPAQQRAQGYCRGNLPQVL